MKVDRVFLAWWMLLAVLGLMGGFSCKHPNPDGVHYIIVGNYVFAFPLGFELDQEMQTITVGELEFHYQAGSITNFRYTDTEFAYENRWKNDAIVPYWDPEFPYPCLDVLGIRKSMPSDKGYAEGYRYIAKCQIDSTVFEHTIRPRNVDKTINFKIDTVDHIMRKIYWSKDNAKGSLWGISLRGDCCDPLYYVCQGAYLEAIVHNEAERQMALRIFETGKHVK